MASRGAGGPRPVRGGRDGGTPRRRECASPGAPSGAPTTTESIPTAQCADDDDHAHQRQRRRRIRSGRGEVQCSRPARGAWAVALAQEGRLFERSDGPRRIVRPAAADYATPGPSSRARSRGRGASRDHADPDSRETALVPLYCKQERWLNLNRIVRMRDVNGTGTDRNVFWPTSGSANHAVAALRSNGRQALRREGERATEPRRIARTRWQDLRLEKDGTVHGTSRSRGRPCTR